MNAAIHRALGYLASRCDGAHARDGEGFSRFDRERGIDLASSDPERWSDGQRVAAHRLATKYRRQLGDAGIELPPLPMEQKTPAPRPSRSGFTATIEGQMVALRSGGFPGEIAVDQVKRITGRSFAKSPTPTWWAPMSSAAEVLAVIRSGYATATDEVLDKLRQVIAAQAETVQASQRIDADIVVEGLGGTLRPFQRGGVAYLTQHRRVLLADEMGLGKTVQALAATWQLKTFPAVVVCPASLKPNWEREARKWLPLLRHVEVVNGKGAAIQGAGLVVINYDVLPQHLEALIRLRPKCLIFDESHYLKSSKAQRTVAAKQLAAVASVEALFLLSGTPVLNCPPELIPQLEILGRLRELGGWKGFTSRYCIRSTFGGFARNGRDLEHLNTAMRAKGMFIRRLKKDVLTELPEKQRVTVPIELSNRAEYDRTLKACKEKIRLAKIEKQNAARQLREPEGWAIAAAVTAVTELRKTVARLKLKAAIAWLGEMTQSAKVVVFAHHREIVTETAKALGAPMVMGDMRPEDRQAAVDRFQNDESCRAIVLNLRAGGVGLTLTAASNVAFIERGWTPGDNLQAEDRCHRIGQRDSVTAWYLDAEGTIDDWMRQLLKEKTETVDAATEGNQAAIHGMTERLAAMMLAS